MKFHVFFFLNKKSCFSLFFVKNLTKKTLKPFEHSTKKSIEIKFLKIYLMPYNIFFNDRHMG